MLIKESQLITPSINILDQLDKAVYLTHEESKMHPIEAAVCEMSRLGEGTTMVRFSDVERLAEDSGVSYMDAVAAIAEASEVDASKMTIAVDEEYIIENGMDISGAQNVSVIPVSESSLAYRYVTECINSWADKESTAEVDAMLEAALVEDTALNDFLDKHIDNLKLKDVVMGGYELGKSESDADQSTTLGKVKANAAGAVQGMKHGVYITQLKARKWIASKVSALRKMYSDFMKKAQSITDTGIKNKLKKVAAKILSIIDKLLKKVEEWGNRPAEEYKALYTKMADELGLSLKNMINSDQQTA